MEKVSSERLDKVKQKLDYWCDQLRDISGRNRLLFWKDTKSSSAVITEPDLFSIFDRIVVKDRTLTAPLPEENETLSLFDHLDDPAETMKNTENRLLGPNECASDKTIKQFNRTLKNLRYKSRTIREEQGFNALYMAFGMLKWQETPGSEYTESPLILVPVDIARENIASPFTISMFEDEIVVNPTLQAYLQNSFAVELPNISHELSTDGLKDYLDQAKSIVKNYKWEVLSKVVLGIFNFQTLMIIKDIENNADHFIESPIIQMLSGLVVEQAYEPTDIPTSEELDDKVDPASVYQILDADSSQQEAIEAAKRGVSLVLQGPPGTGKSQTIANIIAEFLAANKKVLFVSQKAAALEVVKDRLDKRGLGEFCLEVHSHNKDKKDVINSLSRSLESQSRLLARDTSSERLELSKVRATLNGYVRALHKPRFRLGISLFRVQGELALLLDAPVLKFTLPNLEHLSSEQFQKYLLHIREMISYDSLINNYQNHPWKGVSYQAVTLQQKEDISSRFLKGAQAIIDFREKMQAVAEKYALFKPQTLREGINLLRVLSVYHSAVFTEEYRLIVDRYDTEYMSSLRYFSINFWKDSSALAKVHRQQKRIDPKSAAPLLTTIREIRNTAIESGLTPISRPSLNEQGLKDRIDLYNRLSELITFSRKMFDKNESPSALKSAFDIPMSALADWFLNQANHIDDIVEWINFNNLVKEAETIGLSDFIGQVLNSDLHPKQWETTFLRRFYSLFADLIIQSDKSLSQFRSSAHKTLIEQFKKLDQEIIEASSLEIKYKLQQSRPTGSWISAQSAETSILKREANKKRRIKPLRILFKEIPNLLLTLRPCLMMSPLTVSQLLDPEVFHFDIAIFDEASQIPPEYAVGTLMRADQVIIAGDRYQLPPTRFFQAFETDNFDEEDYDTDEYESILHACDSIMIPNKMLLWHYRSQDESLIAFSNYQFYDNKLLTFPNVESNHETAGLEFIYLPDGIYKRGHGARYNLIEARKIAQIVIDHLRTSPELSIGVVTFSQSQRDVIENEIDRVKKENPDLYSLFTYEKNEPFFVKNLENVQGDERDVIVFSVGYGKDETGNLSMNFGPLNRQGGERRLNVAVTRARVRVKLVASFEPEDIDLTRTESRGARLLRNYMKTARDGVPAIYEDETINPNAEFESPFEEAVYNELSKRGIQLIKQVGVSNYRIDFGVVDPDKPGRWLLGIECDGATYHSTPTARDRDRLRQQLLEEKYGWRIHRIWSRDWINDPEHEIYKILHAIDESKKNGSNNSGKAKNNNPVRFESKTINEANPKSSSSPQTSGRSFPSNAQQYQKGILKKQRYRGATNFHNTAINNISNGFIAIVDFEGPIHRKVAKRRVADAFDVRIGSKVDKRLEWAIAYAEKNGKIKVDGDFLLSPSMKKIPLRIHKSGNAERDIDEIYPQEIDAGLIECVKNSMSISRDDLVVETAKLFGLRVTKKVLDNIQPRITFLLRSQEINIQADKIVLQNF